MKKLFENPELEVLTMAQDIIATSGEQTTAELDNPWQGKTETIW